MDSGARAGLVDDETYTQRAGISNDELSRLLGWPRIASCWMEFSQLNVLLLERDDHARTALEMVLALRGHHVDLCPAHATLIERLRRTSYDFVLYGIETTSPAIAERLKEIRTVIGSSPTMLIGVVDEQEAANLAPETMQLINQVLVRPLDLDMLDLQFEAFEQVARARPDAGSALPRVPFEAVTELADRGLELGLLLDNDGQVQFATAGVEMITGHEPQSFLGRSVLSIIHPDDRPGVRDLLRDESGGTTMRVRIMGDGESVSWFNIRLVRFTTARDTEAVILAGQRAAPTGLFKKSAAGGDRYGDEFVVHIDRDGKILFRTGAISELFGISETHQDLRLDEFIFQEDRDTFTSCLANLPDIAGGQRRCLVRVFVSGDQWRTLELICTNLLGVAGVDAIIINAEDVTRRKSLEQHLMRRAFLDPLTGLPNRVFFLSRLERALARSLEDGTSVAVLFLDLDRFKLINDSLGHEVGDQLLIAVGHRLKRAVRPGDIVARFGGDEMIVLLEGVSELDETISVADRIIDGIRDPLVVGDHEVSISTSVGIAFSEPDLCDANLLIRNADIALYRAKELGASRYTVFDERMAQRVVERLEMENDLRNALDYNELSVEFLPELDLEDGRLAALEVLTRWRHPEKGEINPAEFMEVAEESGLIVRLGRWALSEACRHIRHWQLRHPDSSRVMVAINMSVREFQQPDIVEFIASTLEEHDISPSRVRLEIDERSLAADPDDTLEKVEQLRSLGISFAIDNFGSDFSSLSLFTRFSFDVLKVDRQFISGNEHMVSNLSIVRAVTSLAHALGMRVSAEGIETREQLARIRAAGCDYGQGYLFSKSIGAARTEALFLSAGINEAA